MLIILFFLAFISIYLHFKDWNGIKGGTLESILTTSILIYLGSELLSSLSLINHISVRVYWAILDLFLFALLIFRRNSIKVYTKVAFPNSIFPYFVIVWLLLLYSITFFIVVYTPPYNWDSMTYHLPRIFQWIQNDSLNHFATTNTRQINLTPFAEYIGMHFYLLSDDDFGFNLVQWLFSISILISVFKITKLYQAEGNAKWFSVLLVSTMPMLILQSSSTQNDLVAAFFLLSSFYFAEKSRQKFDVKNSIFLGISVGFAVLSKGTNYIFLVPLAIWIAYWVLKKRKAKIPFVQVSIVLGLFIMINTGYWLRNYQVYEKPIAKGGFFVKSPNSSTLISNAIKNSSQNLFLSITYFNTDLEWASEFDEFLQTTVFKIHKKLGLKVDNGKKSWINTSWYTFKYRYSLISEDFESNPLQFFLISFFIIPILISYKHKKWKPLLLLIFISIFGFLIFSFLLKWQPWHNRQLVGIIALGAISISIYLSRFQILIWMLGILLIIYALNPLFDHEKRSFLKDDKNYIFNMTEKEMVFSARRKVLKDFLLLEKEMKILNPITVGLDLNFDDWEYPIWYYLWDENKCFFHLNVSNLSKSKTNKTIPDVFISTRNKNNPLKYQNTWYSKIYISKNKFLYNRIN